ncbi:MAG TPA: hypothetical protein VHY56_00525 [Candidatus Binataceae bacterium]|nr:hypothetical protein [Candidatus Binataceae bacterium]
MRRTALLIALSLLTLPGCALFLSSGPGPRVEDCAQIRQATPTEYYCDGKLYTSVQLADIRNGKTPVK